MKYNIIYKAEKGREYIITDMIATKLNEKTFNKLKEVNQSLLGDYRFMKSDEVDFSWWGRITKYLTLSKITTAYFDIDFWGNVTKY